jgi:hypothetical protein
MAEPHDAAALARASLRCASVAALTTYPRLAARPHLTTVAVTAGEDGSAVVLLRPGAPAAQQLLARPFATVTVAPAGCERVTLHGAVQRLAGKDQAGRLAFRVEAGAVRLGDDEIPVATTAYASANPDPFGRDASAVVAHLRHPHHAGQLTACLRALGHDAQFAEAVALDRRGMTVLAVGLDGVTLVYLDFPAPIAKLTDLPPDLHVLLTCRCGGCGRPASSTDLPGGL